MFAMFMPSAPAMPRESSTLHPRSNACDRWDLGLSQRMPAAARLYSRVDQLTQPADGPMRGLVTAAAATAVPNPATPSLPRHQGLARVDKARAVCASCLGPSRCRAVVGTPAMAGSMKRSLPLSWWTEGLLLSSLLLLIVMPATDTGALLIAAVPGRGAAAAGAVSTCCNARSARPASCLIEGSLMAPLLSARRLSWYRYTNAFSALAAFTGPLLQLLQKAAMSCINTPQEGRGALSMRSCH
mmetsp:Transcript_19089/g.48503  ORF Transcript_19089/g.48503 Transcript_19089/m.48503 type:complete len:242 (-) Transcript_19089:102-827(-)